MRATEDPADRSEQDSAALHEWGRRVGAENHVLIHERAEEQRVARLPGREPGAFLSPPVAMSAYYLKNVMPQWGLGMIYKGMAQFMVIQVVCLLMLLMWPEIVLWLPRALK